MQIGIVAATALTAHRTEPFDRIDRLHDMGAPCMAVTDAIRGRETLPSHGHRANQDGQASGRHHAWDFSAAVLDLICKQIFRMPAQQEASRLLGSCKLTRRKWGIKHLLLIDTNTIFLIKSFVTSVIILPVILASIDAAAQGNLSSQIERSIEALGDPDTDIRQAAASALGEIGPAAEPAMPALVKALEDVNLDVRREATSALVKVGPAAVPALVKALEDEDVSVRWAVASALMKVGPAAELTVPALVKALGDVDMDVRWAAASALREIGPAAEPAVPALVKALEDEDVGVRQTAASALGGIGPSAEPAVPALVKVLEDEDVRQIAASALVKVGPAAVPALVKALEDEDVGVRQTAASALGGIGPAAEPAVPALVKALEDVNLGVSQTAASALGRVGPAAVPALVKALEDEDVGVRWAAASALMKVGPAAKPAAPALVKALEDEDVVVRQMAASALGGIGPSAEPAVPALVKALEDEDVGVRQIAASALVKVGPAAEPAVPALVKALEDEDVVVRQMAASALGQIAISLHDAGTIKALGSLREAQTALRDHVDHELREYAAPVKRAVDYLELHWWNITTKDMLDWINKNFWTTITVSAYIIWSIICLGLFCLRPITILNINDIIRPFIFKLPDWLGGMTISPRYLLLVGVLNYHPRVLDAWVLHHIAKARRNFEGNGTVKARLIHVPVPVHLDNEVIPELTGRHLRAVFGMGAGRLLIWGEGGAGKTSIACQIAHWAMADAPDQRPAPHRMLPVLIERELDFEVGEKKDPFTETVRGDLEKLIEEQVGDELLAALLKRRRVLVIVDHLSEMTDTTRKRVRPDVPGFPAAALVVTSRLEERLGDVPKTSLKPLRVTGDYLSEFMGAYLRAREVRELFPDREFFQAGARIAELVGERDVTVLLVKLYLDRLIETKEKGGDVEKEMPGSIPSLMLSYLNDINGAVPEDIRRDKRAVHRDAEALAWTCLKERFRPGPARIDEAAAPALVAVNPEGVGERLDYLERRLRLVETVEPERDRVRFTLDPVAEYLAGLHAVERYQADEEAWRGFLAQADAMPGGLEVVRGFLLAVRDCCLAKDGEVGVPEFVSDGLAERAGLDLERLRQARLQERIARYTRQLKAADADDRLVAVEVLKNIGLAAEPAVPALIKALADPNVGRKAVVALTNFGLVAVPALTAALADPDRRVGYGAAYALGEIGPAAESAVPALVEVLADPDPAVRYQAVVALGIIGPAAVPALVEALADPNVRLQAATALGRIGPAAELAVPVLIEALTDPEVRQEAATALGRIGPAAEPAVPALVEVLADQDRAVRYQAAVALGEIGPAAVPALAAALADPNVRLRAAMALGEIGPAAEPAVPALVEAFADPDPDVRQEVADALGRIGPAAVPALTAALADLDPDVWHQAADALGRIGPVAEQTMSSWVRQVLQDRS